MRLSAWSLPDYQIGFFLVSQGTGDDLAFYQDLLDAALEDVRILTYGAQGPFDTSCCTEVVASGTPGATLTVFDSLVDDAGNALDGENNFPVFPSGDGQPGGDFVVQFEELHFLMEVKSDLMTNFESGDFRCGIDEGGMNSQGVLHEMPTL